jgi:hypothetical protein
MLQQVALHYITEQTLADLYRKSTEGDKRPLESHGQHKSSFVREKDSMDG